LATTPRQAGCLGESLKRVFLSAKNNLKSLPLLKQKEEYKIFTLDNRNYKDTTAIGPKNIRRYQDTLVKKDQRRIHTSTY
jgi:hypothetical protein